MSGTKTGPTVTVTQIIHDLRSRTSYVTVVWNDRQEKKLGLPIPFGTRIEDIAAETARALNAFRDELDSVSIELP